MEEMKTQTNDSHLIDTEKADAERERLLQLVESLTAEVKRLSERIDLLEHSPRQTKCILCPTIHINFPMGIKIPFGNTSHK